MILFEAILLVYFLYVVGYTLSCSLAATFNTYQAPTGEFSTHKMAVLVPAYKEDAVIVAATVQNLHVTYPPDAYKIYVIADSLQDKTLKALALLDIGLIEVSFEKSTKVKALNHALASIKDSYELAVILDADNIMALDFLTKVNACFAQGHTVIQGQRKAKNTDTDFALLDGLSEMINNHIYRKGNCGLGWSSSLIGSGMAFQYDLLKKSLAEMESIGGFDRELEIRLLLQGHKAKYLPDAHIFDEKVKKAEVFAGQRKRWIASQYHYLARYWGVGMRALLKGNWALFNSTILRNVQLPRVINLGLLFLTALLSTLFYSFLNLSPWIWWGLLLALGLSFVPAVPRSYYTKDFFRSLAKLPRAFAIMFSLLFKLKGANKTFIHTPHGPNSGE